MEPLTIIANGLVITCDARRRAGRYSILVRDGRIADVSESAPVLESLYPEATVIDASGKIVSPGFVNAHVHSESLLLARLTAGKHYVTWRHDLRLREAAAALADPAAADDLRVLYQASYFTHLKNGTTCTGEFPLPVDNRGLTALQQGIERTGARAVVALQNWDQITHAREHETGRERYAVSVGREEDYTVYSISNMVRVARELGTPLQAQVEETRDDAETVRRNFQKSTVAVLRDFAALGPGTLLVHLNHGSASEAQIAAASGASIALCARSAAFKRTGYPFLRHLGAIETPLCIGTDWGSFDMMEEIRFLRQLPMLFPSMPSFTPRELLLMATLNGARALGLGTDVGSIEPGKRADLVFFSLPVYGFPMLPESPGEEDLLYHLVDHLTARDISDVMIEGKFQLLGHEIRTMPEDNIVTALRRLEEKFLPDDVRQGRGSAAHEEATARPRLIPFIPPENPPELEGFEEGFTIVEKPSDSPPPPDATPPPPPALPPASPLKVVRPETPDERAATRPELSKNVRRVFGEDDEPSP